MTEEWRDVVGYEGLYKVSSVGRVKSLARTYRAQRKGVMADIPVPERILARTILKIGYYAVGLSRNGETKTFYVHRLVCEAWHGPRPEKHDTAHNDGNKLNCAPENLRWATRRENLADKVRHGKQPRGDDLWFTKIPDATVLQIRADRSVKDTEWAAALNCSASHIRGIRAGNERVHVKAL